MSTTQDEDQSPNKVSVSQSMIESLATNLRVMADDLESLTVVMKKHDIEVIPGTNWKNAMNHITKLTSLYGALQKAISEERMMRGLNPKQAVSVIKSLVESDRQSSRKKTPKE